MSDIQSNINRHVKKQETMTHNNKKNQSMKTNPEMIQMIELVDKDIKSV